MSNSTGILVLALGDNTIVQRNFAEDVSLISTCSMNVASSIVPTSLDLLQAIEKHRPAVLYVLVNIESAGRIEDGSGLSLRFSYLMKRAEQMGVQLLILATGTNIESIENEIIPSDAMDFMVVTNRNRHFPTFLRGLVKGMAGNCGFASVYVSLAPQHESVQRGRPLPGSIAICPSSDGQRLFLWSEPQE